MEQKNFFLWSGLRVAGRIFRFPVKEGASEKAKLLWLVKLRWLAILLFFILCAPALVVGFLTTATVPIYLGILSILIVFNLLSQMLIAKSEKAIGPFVICFQLAFDLFVLAGLLNISGGFNNPFVVLFLLNVSLGAILISDKLSGPFLLLTHALLAALQFQTLAKNEEMLSSGLLVTFLVYHLLVAGFWFVMRSLGSYLEKQSELQSQSRIALEKQDRLRSIGALTAGFSHEFASPLNVAKIRLERLKRYQDSDDLHEALDAILVCEKVIQQMNSSQLDTRDFQFKSVVVGDLLRDVVDSWSEDKQGVRLAITIKEQITSLIPPVNFSQVVLNLLDNAFEACPQGVISICCKLVDGEVNLCIEDEGEGIPELVLRSRGEPFVTTKPHGTGLGLYVSELFAQNLGGRLELCNRLPKGASVSLVWPQREVL